MNSISHLKTVLISSDFEWLHFLDAILDLYYSKTYFQKVWSSNVLDFEWLVWLVSHPPCIVKQIVGTLGDSVETSLSLVSFKRHKTFSMLFVVSSL